MGELIEHEPQLPAATTDQPAQVFNPLDAEPVRFAQQLSSRTENYDALAMHLRGVLVPDKDFGRIHVAKRCDNKWNCTNERHYSGFTLFAAGADKVLGILGLAVHYPGEESFIKAALAGRQIEDVILKAHIIDSGGQAISEGIGACSKSETNGNLNNCLKKAAKRARLDAVLRLPAISALFEDDFLAQVKREAARSGGNTTTGRAKAPKVRRFNSGAELETWPFAKPPELAGARFEDMKDETLEWILRKLDDKPDIWNAAKRVHDSRLLARQARTDQPGGEAERETAKPAPGGTSDNSGAAASHDDWLSDYEGAP